MTLVTVRMLSVRIGRCASLRTCLCHWDEGASLVTRPIKDKAALWTTTPP